MTGVVKQASPPVAILLIITLLCIQRTTVVSSVPVHGHNSTAVSIPYREPPSPTTNTDDDSSKPGRRCQPCRAHCAESSLPFWMVGSSVTDENVYDVMHVSSGLPVPSIKLVSSEELSRDILVSDLNIKNNSEAANCTVVILYAHWCPWCAKAAPHLNAVSRAFKNIQFVAVDVDDNPGIIVTLGVFSVPSVLLFHNGRIKARFTNKTAKMHHVAEFLEDSTDQKAGVLQLKALDYQGPLRSVKEDSYQKELLCAAWSFIGISLIYLALKLECAFQLFLKMWMAAQKLMVDKEFQESKFR